METAEGRIGPRLSDKELRERREKGLNPNRKARERAANGPGRAQFPQPAA